MNTVLSSDQIEIISAHINLDNGTLEIIKRQKSNCYYLTYPPKPVPDSVWKEIYGVIDGKIELIETIDGKYIPAYVVEEKFEF